MLKNQILVFSLIGRETMLMKRCILIGFHISTSFPVKTLVWLEENRMAETERDFSEDEFSAALVEALRNFLLRFPESRADRVLTVGTNLFT